MTAAAIAAAALMTLTLFGAGAKQAVEEEAFYKQATRAALRLQTQRCVVVDGRLRSVGGNCGQRVFRDGPSWPRTDPLDRHCASPGYQRVYVLEHSAGTVYVTKAAFEGGVMPTSITLMAADLVQDKRVPEADRRAVQIERLRVACNTSATPGPRGPGVHHAKLSMRFGSGGRI